MSIQIGIYDFFAHTLPGGLYLLFVLLVTEFISPGATGISLDSLGLVELVILGFTAYLLGLVCTPIAFRFWQTVNRNPDLVRTAKRGVLSRFPDFELRFEGAEWPILSARVSLASSELAARIDKHRATGIMLRNATPALVALSLTAILYGSLNAEIVLGVFWCAVLLISAYVSNRECMKYLRWSYGLIFEVTIAEALQSSDLVRLKDWDESRRSQGGSASESEQPPVQPAEPLSVPQSDLPHLPSRTAR